MSIMNLYSKLAIFLLLVLQINSKFLHPPADKIFDEETMKLIDGKLVNHEEENLEGIESIINVKCLWANDLDVYSLQTLQNKDQDYEYEIGQSTNLTTETKKVIFNFCQNTLTQENLNSTVLYEVTDEFGIKTYTRFSGPIDTTNYNETLEHKINEWENFTQGNSSGIRIKLVSGDVCLTKNSVSQHITTLEITCDAYTTQNISDTIDVSDFNQEGCEHTIRFRSVSGCTLNSTYLLRKLIHEYRIIFSIICIIFGFLLCFYGSKFIWFTIIIVVAIATVIVGTVAVLSFLPNKIQDDQSLLILIGVIFLIGIIIGLVLTKAVKAFVFVLGCVLGYSIGLFAYQAIQPLINFNPEILYWVTLIGCSIIFGLVALCILKVILILGTSVIGSFLMIRSIGSLADNYPDETLIIDLIKNGEWDQLTKFRDSWIYIYLLGWALLTVVGISVQCHCTKSSSKKEENEGEYKRK